MNLFEYMSLLQEIQTFKRFKSRESFEHVSHLQRFEHSKDLTLVNLLNISHTCKRFKHLKDSTLVNVWLFFTSAMIQTFKRFNSGDSFEYLSHLQKIQTFTGLQIF